MHIFHKRPLSLILCIILSGFSIFELLSPLYKIFLASLATLITVILFLIRSLEAPIVAKIACIALLCSFLLSHLYFNSFYPSEYYGKEVEVKATVAEVDTPDENTQTLTVNTSSINGDTRSYSLIMTLYGYTESIEVNSKIEFIGTLKALTSSSAFDYKAFYTARGISAQVVFDKMLSVSEGKASLEQRFTQAREAICQRAVNLSGESAGGLLSALLLGERDMLDNQLELDFMRLGITHILSLGGFHLAILMGTLEILLSFCMVEKRIRISIGCIFCFLFMAFTGFQLTVVRAGLMLILSSLLILACGLKDSITSLFISAVIMLLFEPYCALDIGFWLSVLATFGILLVGNYVNGKCSDERLIKKLWISVKISALFSLFAIASTSAITSVCFDGVSTVGILTTMLYGFLLNAYIYLGIAALILGGFVPVGNLLTRFSDLIESISAAISDIEWVYSSSTFTAVKILFVILSLGFATFAIMKIKCRKSFIAALSVIYVTAIGLATLFTRSAAESDAMTVFHEKNAETVLILSDGETLLFDASNHSADTAFDSYYILASNNVAKLEHYYACNYSTQLSEYLTILLSRISVSKIHLPLPITADEEENAVKILKTAKNYHTEVSFYEIGDILSVGEYTARLVIKRIDMDCFITQFKRGEEACTYLTSGALEYCDVARYVFFDNEIIILGDFGVSYKNPAIADEYSKRLRKVIIYGNWVTLDTDIMPFDEKPKIVETRENAVIFD